ncbi:MAG: hypothetical protein AAGG80_03700 [Pseudomonadota bacterium]
MKKLAIIVITAIFFTLTGCSTDGQNADTPWFGSNEFWGSPGPGETHYYDSNGRLRVYREPRRYNISDQDQRKYESMNDRIQQRQQSIQSGSPSGGFGDAATPQYNSGNTPGVNTNNGGKRIPSIPSVPASDS